MNSKKNQNKFIRRLLQIGKKHKILVYPVLALVAVISVFSNLYHWAASSGKRVVAAVLVGVLVLSQSYFMTSSANENDLIMLEDEDSLIDDSAMDDEPEPEESLVDVSAVEDDNDIDDISGDDEVVGSSTTADLEDPEDYRDSSGEMPETKNEDTTSEGTVDIDKYRDAAKGKIVGLVLPDTVDRYPTKPKGTAQSQATQGLPTKLTATIWVGGDPNNEITTNVNVSWTCNEFENSHAATTTFYPILVNQNSYDFEDGVQDSVSVKVTFLATFRVYFNTGAGTLQNNPFLKDGSGYYGYVGRSYELPTVVREKKAGGVFPYEWRVNGSAVSNNYTESDEFAETITFEAYYTEAEVAFEDQFNDTRYDYPVKGTSYLLESKWIPAEYGYSFLGWTVNGTGNPYSTGSYVSSSVDDMRLVAAWRARDYNIVYHTNFPSGAGEGTDATMKHTFGTTGDKLDANTFKRYGYTFTGWAASPSAQTSEFANGTTIADSDGLKALIQSAFAGSSTEDPDINLYAVWKEVAITFENGTTDESGDTTYGEAFDFRFNLDNGETSSGKFSAQFVSATNGSGVTITDYITNLESGATGKQMYVRGIPSRVWDGELVLEFEVSDTVAGTSAPLYVSLTTNKKALNITGISDVDAKTYDRTTVFSDENKNKMTITLDGIYNNDDVSIDRTALKVEYDSQNAGNRTLKLTDVKLTGAKADCYKIDESADIADAAKINRQPLSVTLTCTLTKYAGETVTDPANQDINLDYAEPSASDTALRQMIDQDGGLSEVVKLVYHIPDVNMNETVDVEVESNTLNYDVTFVNASCSLIVTQDKATVGENFVIHGTYNEETGWYNDIVTIAPMIQHDPDYYNVIRMTDGSEWMDEIVIDDDSAYSGKDIQVIVENSRTHAYTSESDVLNIKVDSNAPEYLGATFEAAGNTTLDKIGNFFKYGNFFQETVTAKLSFKDEKSGCKYIYYDLKGGDNWSRKDISDGTFTVDIPLGTNNKITFYVEDNAGNKTEVICLAGNADGTEWVIERNEPVLSGYHMENIKGERISNLIGSNWYNQPVQIVADIIESESGIQYADWYINGSAVRITEDSLLRGTNGNTVSVKYPFTENGVYTVAVGATDNANNSMDKADLATVRVDLDAPVVTIDESTIPDTWTQSVDIRFTATDATSGIYRVSIIAPNGDIYGVNPGADGVYTFTATMGGEYSIYARDEAGNETIKAVKASNVSSDIPGNGYVVWSPQTPDGSNGWYVSLPAVTITPSSATEAPLTTYYKLWNGATEPLNAIAVNQKTTVRVTGDGVWTLKVWTETASGVKSAAEYVQTIYVDTTAPEALITKVLAESAYQTVTFTVTDAASGINANQIKVMNGVATVSSKVTALSDKTGYQGTFTVSSPGEYVIQVSDQAGNVATSTAYKPMTLKVNAIRNITKTTATIGSVSYRGTYAIASVKYEYKKSTSSKYKEITPYLVRDAEGNLTASYAFKNLESNTKYDYRITSVSAIGEALNYTGSFKTSGVDGITIKGKAVDADDSSAKITVTLSEGSTVLKTTDIKSGGTFTFSKVADGNYNISATNGLTNRTMSVNVYNGKVIDPKGDILLTLRNGMSTSVTYSGSKVPNVSVSGLDDIFTYDTVNFTEDDKKFIAEGGTVEFRLNIAYKTSGAIAKSTLSAIYKLMSDNEKVNMFLDFTLTKIRTYASGVIESTKTITQLGGGVKIKLVIPMSSKVVEAKEKSIIRVHNSKASLLADLDASVNSYTLETNQFSIYALTYKGTSNTSTDNSPGSSDDGGKSIKDYDASPKTGDGTPIAVLGGLLLFSMAGMVILKKKYK